MDGSDQEYSEYSAPLQKIVSRLPDQFRILQPLLNSEPIILLLEASASLDKKANSVAANYKRIAYLATWSILASFLFAVVGMLIGGVAKYTDLNLDNWGLFVESLQFLALAAALGALGVVVYTRMRLRWTESREFAEKARLRQFMTILQSPVSSEHPDSGDVLQAKYQFIHFALLQPQLAYFRDRLAKAQLIERNEQKLRIWILLGFALAASISFFSGIHFLSSLIFEIPEGVRSIMTAPETVLVEEVAKSIGTLALGWLAFRGVRRSLFDHRVAAARLHATLHELQELEGVSGNAHARLLELAAENNVDAIVGWLKLIAAVLSNDRNLWVKEMDVSETEGSDVGALLQIILNVSVEQKRPNNIDQ